MLLWLTFYWTLHNLQNNEKFNEIGKEPKQTMFHTKITHLMCEERLYTSLIHLAPDLEHAPT